MSWLPEKGSVSKWPSGATDNASDYGSEDCRFESCLGQSKKNIFAPPGGLEPPTFRLTAERASRLRHGGFAVLAA